MKTIGLLVGVCFLLVGCSATQKQEVTDTLNKVVDEIVSNPKVVASGLQTAVSDGLVALAGKNAGDAKLAATLLSAQAKTASKYFSTGVLPIGQDASVVLNALWAGLPSNSGILINTASGILSGLINLPNGTTVLTADQTTLVVDACNAVSLACDKYLASLTAAK